MSQALQRPDVLLGVYCAEFDRNPCFVVSATPRVHALSQLVDFPAGSCSSVFHKEVFRLRADSGFDYLGREAE